MFAGHSGRALAWSTAAGAQASGRPRLGNRAACGSLFEYFRNDVTDANDWFNDMQRLPKAALRFNNFGRTFSGPIRFPYVYDIGAGRPYRQPPKTQGIITTRTPVRQNLTGRIKRLLVSTRTGAFLIHGRLCLSLSVVYATALFASGVILNEV